MKQHDVVLGQVYAVKVSGRVQPVRLIAESPYGGWVGRNEQTGREIRIRSAARLRARLEKQGDRWRLALNQQTQPAPQADLQFQQELTDRMMALAFRSMEKENANCIAITVNGGENWTLKTLDVNPHGDPLDITGPALTLGDAGALHALSVRRRAKSGLQAVMYHRLQKANEWSAPVELAAETAGVSKHYPVIAASRSRVHAAWVERADGWSNVWYRGSLDSGKTWSDRVVLSTPDRPTAALTPRGFRDFAGHYMSIAEDGRGVGHVVWGARQDGRARGEIWHASVGTAAKKE